MKTKMKFTKKLTINSTQSDLIGSMNATKLPCTNNKPCATKPFCIHTNQILIFHQSLVNIH